MVIFISIILLTIFFWAKGCIKDDSLDAPYITLYLSQADKIERMDFEEYLIGCVSAEMPASFEIEALKAQAVCARTYALRKLINKHAYPQGANLSDDITTCQAYVSESEFKNRHPKGSQQLLSKIKQAVRETTGMIMLYDGMPIDAVYHSTCGGHTASGLEAWGNEVAYLQSVACSYCQESRHYQTIQVFSYQDINADLGIKLSSKSQIRINKYAPSGRVSEINLDGDIFKTNKIRSLLNLPSNWLNITATPQNITIISHGYGHGAGLCQYGANGMAKEDFTYEQILKYYYQEIKIKKVKY